jgi:hypothetical protein
MNGCSQHVETAFESERVLTVTSYGHLSRERACINDILAYYLNQVGLSPLFGNISYCIHELAVNAHKANLKRLYFRQRGLDIRDHDDYQRGMAHFKEEVLNNIEEKCFLLRDAGYYVKYHFQLQGQTLKIVVRNNARLVRQERERIKTKLKLAAGARTLVDVYAVAEDYSEGAGLGLVMLNIMLRNMGFSDSKFNIHQKGRETIAFISLNIADREAILRTLAAFGTIETDGVDARPSVS